MLGDDQLTRIFERTTFINRVTGRHKDPDVPLDKRFQEEIVVSFLHSVASLLTALSSSFTSTLASSDEECLQIQGVM